MIRSPRTSTAILLALSLAQPMPVVAQGQSDQAPEGAVCADGNAPPCAEGVPLLIPGQGLGTGAAPAPAPAPGAAAPAEPAAPAEQPAPAEQTAPEQPMPQAAAPTETAPADAAPAETAPTETAPAETAPAGTESAPTEAAPEQPAAEAPAPAGTAPAAEQPAAPAPETAPQAAPESAPAPAGTQGETAPAAAPADSGQTAPAAEPAQPEAQGQGKPAPEAPAPAAAAPVTDTAAAPVVQQDASPAQAEQAEQVLRLLGAAPAPEAGAGSAEPPAAAAAEAEAPAQAVIETAITEEDSRQSSEDFATTASGAARVGTAENGAPRRGGGGLSDFEKAALVGLGVLAVGAILNNGDEVVANTGDRVVLRRGADDYYVLKDDDTLLRRPGSTVRTESFADGSTRSTVTRENGVRIVTIRDAAGRVLRRTRIGADGREVLLIDDTETYEAVEVERLPEPVTREVVLDQTDPAALRRALEAAARDPGRSFSLRQVREIERVRKLVPEIAFRPVTFRTGSAAIDPTEAEELSQLGDLMAALIRDNPREVFLIEGHTDAVGPASTNLALSDRRAESVALALTEYFDVPPENMVVQGYGESDLKVDTLIDERANRRVTVRRITPLLDQRLARN